MSPGIAYCNDCGQNVVGDAAYDEEGVLRFIKQPPSQSTEYRCYICQYNRRDPREELLLSPQEMDRIERDNRIAKAVEFTWERVRKGEHDLGEWIPWGRLAIAVDDESERRLLAGAIFTLAEQSAVQTKRWAKWAAATVVLSTLVSAVAFVAIHAQWTTPIAFGTFVVAALGAASYLRIRGYWRIQQRAFYSFADMELVLLLEKEGIIGREGAWWRRGQMPPSALRRHNTRREVRETLSQMTPGEFEKSIGDVFRTFGYEVEVTPFTRDRGVDLLMRDENGVTFAVQVKQLTSGLSVGRPELQKLQGAMLDAKSDKAMFVTLSHFTEPAKRYAREHGIRLIDGDEIVDMIAELEE